MWHRRVGGTLFPSGTAKPDKSFAQMVHTQFSSSVRIFCSNSGGSIFPQFFVSFFLLREPCLNSLALVLMLKMALLSVSIVILLKLHELFSFPLLCPLIFGLKLYLLLSTSSIFNHHLLFRVNALEKYCMAPLLDMIIFVFLAAHVTFFYHLVNAPN